MYWLASNANINSNIHAAPIIKTYEDNPSLNNTNTKLQKTNAEPVSFCSKISSIGIAITVIADNFVFIFFYLLLVKHKIIIVFTFVSTMQI